MNDYDDIFDKEENKTQEKAIEQFEYSANKNEKNGILLAIYFFVMLLVSFGFEFYGNYVYPNGDAILDNLDFGSPVIVNVTATPDSDYAYQYVVNGSLINNSDTNLQTAFIEIEFFDEANKSLGVYTYSEEDLLIGDEMFIVNDTFEADINYSYYEIAFGFDVYNNTNTFFNLLPVFLCSLIFFFIDYDCFKCDWLAFRKNWKQSIRTIVIGFLSLIAIGMISSVLLALFQANEISMNEAAIQSMFTKDADQLIMLFALLVVFTPFVEEVIFRKVLYNFIETRLGKIVAILSSGLIFGLMHVLSYGDFIQSIPYVFMGVAFGYFYYSSKKNIWVTVGIHSLNNLYIYIVYLGFILGGGTF